MKIRPVPGMRPVVTLFVAVLVLGVTAPGASLEAQGPFTVDDMANLASFSLQEVSPDGRWAVGTVSSRMDRFGQDHRRQGDPTYVAPSFAEVHLLDLQSGEMRQIVPGKVRARSFAWSPDGSSLAFLLLSDTHPTLHLWNPATGELRELPLRSGKPISTGSGVEWLPDGRGLIVTLRAEDWHDRATSLFAELTEGPIIVLDGSDDLLAWDRLRGMSSLGIPARVDPASGEVVELLDEEADLAGLELVDGGSRLVAQRRFPLRTAYIVAGSAEWDVVTVPTGGGAVVPVVERTDSRPSLTWSEAGARFARAERGDVLVSRIGSEDEPENLTAAFRERTAEAGADTTGLRFSVQRFSPDGNRLLLQSSRGWWLQDPSGGDPELVFPFEGDEDARPQRSVTEWSRDGAHLYITTSARDRWERGLLRLDLAGRQVDTLVLDAGLRSSWRFLGENGDRILFQHSDGDRPSEWYVADAEVGSARQLTEMNPWIHDRSLTRSELVSYLDVDGNELFGILYYPVDYEEGRRYPLVAEIYETYFNNGFNVNMNMFTNAGYFGFRPSVNLEQGYPGEGWVKGVTTAINGLIERGLVDPDRLGVQGGSYGGYATALLVTQTDRFAAAINISGKVNMVSFYGDSPRLGARNITAPERGQDRLGCSLWECRDRYLAHSAILDADRITTPLMLITGELDHNVPARQSMEMYYAMRRLGKEVVWVNYANGGHSPPNTMDELTDYWERILGWYDRWFEGERGAAAVDGED